VFVRERSTGREYAMKILDKKHIIKEKKIKYVHIEKNTLNKLNHPGIIHLFYAFQDIDNLCIL
jgi:3-phosphoinositide dependent protein kinase-1